MASGRWFAELKAGRTYVAGKAFDTKREAQAWYNRERAALAGGVDPRAGRATVRTLLPIWLDERRHSVSAKTYTADAALPRLTPTALAALNVAAVTDREVSRALVALTRRGLAESSVRRFRDSLSAFFAWAVRERMIVTNPVTPTRVPKSPGTRTEMFPLPEAELEEVYVDAVERDERLADLLLIDAWTGLRWSELRAIRVRDFIEVPLPVLVVQRAAPEGVRVKARSRGNSHQVPVADHILQLIKTLTIKQNTKNILYVTRHQLVGIQADARMAEGCPWRRIHDLRHSAACLWLARGVDPVTVQAWMGHASIATKIPLSALPRHVG